MTDQPTAYIAMIGDSPTSVATDLAVAQEAALARETKHDADGNREFRWDDHRDGWRLMARRPEKGARWSWTLRSIRTAPFLPATEA